MTEKRPCEVVYCDTLAHEHPDNVRFMRDVEAWIGQPITLIRSENYTDIFDVFDKEKWLVGPKGARCTTELKKRVRMTYQEPDDIHVFGFTADEYHRIVRFRKSNPELYLEWPLLDGNISKADCLNRLRLAGIAVPVMYRLGYKNNNCIGCVKGGAGYWNKIRNDFPLAFDRMAKQERKMGVTILRTQRNGIRHQTYLDELSPTAGVYSGEPDIECGPQCLLPGIIQ